MLNWLKKLFKSKSIKTVDDSWLTCGKYIHLDPEKTVELLSDLSLRNKHLIFKVVAVQNGTVTAVGVNHGTIFTASKELFLREFDEAIIEPWNLKNAPVSVNVINSHNREKMVLHLCSINVYTSNNDNKTITFDQMLNDYKLNDGSICGTCKFRKNNKWIKMKE